MRSAIRISEGWSVLDLRHDGEALPQEALCSGIACAPANWRDVFGRTVFRDEHGNEFCIERRAGRWPCLYLVHPVETEEDAEQEPFLHALEEAVYA